MATTDLPAEFAEALAGDEVARARFEALPPSHQREWVEYIGSGRKAETRQRRAVKAVETLHAEASQ